MASNHVSFADHYITPGVVPRPIKYLAKAEYFEKPVSRFIYKNSGQIPVNRGKGDADALKYAREYLRKGGVVGIYPEGTRSVDGFIHEGKTGVARLAIETGAPIIPQATLGTYEAMPKHQHWIKPIKLTCVFGPPIDVTPFKGRENDRELCRALTDHLMFEIEKLAKPHHRIEPKLRKQMVKRRKKMPLESFLKES